MGEVQEDSNPIDPNAVAGHNIRMLRQSLNLTLRELGERVDAHLSNVSRTEHGNQHSMTLDTLGKYAEALGVEPWMLLHPDLGVTVTVTIG